MGLSKALQACFQWFRLLPNTLILYFVLVLAITTIVSFSSSFNCIFEVLSHFVIIYTVLLVILSLLALAIRAKIAFGIAVAALLLNLGRLVPDYLPQALPATLRGERIRLIEFNLWGPKNKKPDEISKIAREEQASIVCFCEVEGSRKKSIEATFKDYPYQALFPYNCGLGLVSKLPIENSQVLIADYALRPRMLATVRLKDGQRLSILVVHPTIPLYKDRFEGRNKEFELYAQDLAEKASPKMIVGDLNCTPWSYYFQKLLKDTGLKDSELGFGDQPSWPTCFKLIPFLPIDHCLVSSDIVVTKRKIEREAGSDHRPVLVEFIVPQARDPGR